ncbi:peptide/nickel transport system permease protein [Actinoplanes octamycinicus]|uniref:Peptide/nickel transport system permease protein n=1 Tax=Actinoplanes octamycinicus TaxID=135948 RepID=A0A7W7M9T1_9ACTN|nr:ABC transporter permease [Actinoplanes octamycinicus]MBB4742125.1 peptide/nickel transport system permease protein [Actinoplanes octamycinicus]GIE60029.1 ABC transporter permease [Actinoplanes octamycinicus]
MDAFLGIILRRLAALIPLMLGIILFIFLVMALSPNDAALSVLGDQATPEQVAAFNAANGLDQPLLVRYADYLWALLHGDLGQTFSLSAPIGGIIAAALPVTLQLTALGVSLAVVLALVLGITGALYRDRWPDQLTRLISMAGISIPSFWLAILLIQQLSTIGGGSLPSGHYVAPSESVSGWLQHLILPAVALAVPTGCALARVVRTSMVEELDRDYVRTAVGAGLPPVVVVGRNVLRNALLTPLTVLGLQTGYLIGGAVIIEAIFTLPGMGTQIMSAVQQNDIGLARGLVITIALGFVVVNLVVDLLYLAANPRMRGAH